MDPNNSVYAELAPGKISAEALMTDVLTDRRPLESIFQGLSSKTARVKFGCSKTLLLLSEKHPELLREKIDRIVELLDIENQILKWNAISIIGNLAASNFKDRIKRQLKRMYGFLACGELITANNAIAALGKIACAFPEERKRIAGRLARIEHMKFDTAECRNIAIGKAILAIEMSVDPEMPGKTEIDFARRQLKNPRKATADKAKAFIEKYGAARGYR